MQSTGTAHAKLLLFGEHAAVYGFPAVGLPLPSKLTVSISSAPDNDGWSCQASDQRHIPPLYQLIEEFGNLIPEFQQIRGGTISIDSDIIPDVGLGSSAALCVAFVKAVCGLFSQLKPGFNETWDWANRCERIFHGRPSGIDTGLAHLDRLCAFYPSGSGLPTTEIISNIRLYLLIGIFKRKTNTKELVALIKRNIDHDKACEDQIRKLGTIAQVAIQHLKENKSGLYEKIGGLASNAQLSLSSLGLSTPEQDRFMGLAQREGVLGGKLSGAGGGGAFYLMARDKAHLLDLSNRLEKLSTSVEPEARPVIQRVIWENEQPCFVKSF